MDQDRNSEPQQRVFIDMRAAILLAVVVVVTFALFALNRSGDRWRGDPAAGARSSQAGQGFDIPADAPEATAAAAHAEARAIAVRRIAEADIRIGFIRSHLDESESLLAEWSALQESLLAGDDGRRIASSEELTQQFLALHDNRDPERTRSHLASFREQANALAKPIEEMRANESSVHRPDSLTEELDKLTSDAQIATAQMREHSRALTALKVAARSLEPSEKTLQEAMSVVGGRSAQMHAERLSTIINDGERKRFEHREEIERRKQMMAEIASSPRVREILWFVTDNQSVFEAYYGKSYYDFEYFQKTFVTNAINKKYAITVFTNLHGTQRSWTEETQRRWSQLENSARAAFDMSLHELFRVFMLSETNREEFVYSIDRMRELARGGPDISEKRAQSASHWLEEGRSLPQATLP